MPLHDILRRHGLQRPGATAVVIGGRAVTYGDLVARADRINAVVAACPRVQREQPKLREIPVFGLLMGNHPHVAEFLAAALVGRCCVLLLDTLLPLKQLHDILDRVAPDILFIAGRPADPFQGFGFPVRSVETEADLEILLAAAPGPDRHGSGEDDPFLIAFTSGTTSLPKAFLRNRRSWRKSLAVGRRHFETGPGLHTLSPGPLAHGLSLYAFAETLDAGAAFHTLDKFTPQAAWKTIAENDLQRLVCVPSVLDALCRHAGHAQDPLKSLAGITTAGAKLEDDLLNRLGKIAPRANVTEYYGASELGFVTTVSHQPHDGGYTRGGAGVGRAFPGVDIEIRPSREDTADGTSGTIWVQSALTIDGYLWRDDLSAFQRDGDWSTVGDVGRFDSAGHLHLLGRANGMIISGGNNIYPGEIDACLKNHPAVKEVNTVGLPDTYLGKALVAVLEFEKDVERPGEDELIEHCAENLQKYKIPRRFLQTGEWPMTASGKVSTARLVDWIAEKDERLAVL
ncbi:MAG: class I adenylate-forming enzyme family protein [Rhodobacter sp.]|nr:class I adenylate-forming enzyme family protein [Rhodobacter sp.]